VCKYISFCLNPSAHLYTTGSGREEFGNALIALYCLVSKSYTAARENMALAVCTASVAAYTSCYCAYKSPLATSRAL